MDKYKEVGGRVREVEELERELREKKYEMMKILVDEGMYEFFSINWNKLRRLVKNEII